ncbi:leucine--tRNA ligase [Candidatus Parcubacteria bacterium]|nr:leucine--tRNA ligase [Candidatus Parcubacteria bacterium]
MKYNHNQIEKKWQNKWQESEIYKADDDSKKEKRYILDMFPYPSGAGLHVGHVESYTATDIYSRYLRMKGFNVLHPQGWDAFGLPAENYAIKTGVHPGKTTQKAIKTFKKQMSSLGLSYDWSREINSSKPEYYKWTQWFFLLLYNNGLAYRKKAKVNWCNSCQTVLANEQAEGGNCERCGSLVIQKDLEQWFFKITDFIEDQEYKGKEIKGLLSRLDTIDWPESTKSAQKNWIGKSVGAEVDFIIYDEKVTVFTTRPDTLFGATYFVLSPEHPIVQDQKSKCENQKEIDDYIEKSKKKTEFERTDLTKEKTGVKLKGIKAINPVNNEKIPIFIADYVMMGYGTGAIMAVPAHDERDYEFAKKYNLPVKEVVEPFLIDQEYKIRLDKKTEKREVVAIVVRDPENDNYLCLKWKTANWKSFPTGGIDNDSKVEAAIREIKEETGYVNLKFIKEISKPIYATFFRPHKDSNVIAHFHYLLFDLEDKKKVKVKQKEKDLHEVVWVPKDEVDSFINVGNQNLAWKRYIKGRVAYAEEGMAVNSDFLSGLKTKEAKEKMIEWLEEKKLGRKAINYKMRDWLVSRQRYWGAPIPIIYCDVCGEVPVLESDLPVELPVDVDFKPTGESPLNYSKTFHKVKCPKCGKDARRESDTMDTFVCSSWYYFRFADPCNKKEFADKKLIKKWLPIDTYVGGAEHTVLHLLYSRFFTKALQKFGYIDFNEPFTKLRHQGIILAEDGTKMSKSKGNVVNPDDIVKEYGADALRMYEMFMGPIEDMKPWNAKGIVGIKRFLDRIFDFLYEDITGMFVDDEERKTWLAGKESIDSPNEIKIIINKTIKKVTEDINNFKFNTAISQMMILLNYFYTFKNDEDIFPEGGKFISRNDFKKFLIILSPFAPHITEELWEKLGHKESIFKEKWPEYDPELVKDEKIQLVIQVNGKLRDTVEVSVDISEIEAKKIAQDLEKIKKWIDGKEIVKIIFVKGKLINIVIK